MQHNGVTKGWVLYCRWILYYSQMTIIHCIQGAVSVRFSQSADRILRAAMQTEGKNSYYLLALYVHSIHKEKKRKEIQEKNNKVHLLMYFNLFY